MNAADLRRLAAAQDVAARHARSIGMNYLASQHVRVARTLRAEADRADVQATGRAEAS